MAPRAQSEARAGSLKHPELVKAKDPIVVKTKNGKTFTQSDVVKHVAKFAHADNFTATVQVISTVAIWLYLFRCSWWLHPLHVLMTIRLFVVCVHDPAHGALFTNKAVNTAVAVICGPMTFMPGLWWQYGHGYHHEHSNDLDFDQASQTAPHTVLEFLESSKTYQTAYRYFTAPWVMMSQTSVLSMTVLQAIKATTVIEWTLQLAYLAIAFQTGCLLKYFCCMGMVAPFGVLLFHLQHTYEDTVREHGRDYFQNGYSGSTFLLCPMWLKPFMAAIEVHHIHHINAKVPFYRLYECHQAAPPGMWDGVRTMTFAEGWASLRFVLWDHVQRRLISMEDLDRVIAKVGKEAYLQASRAARDAQVKEREGVVAAREAAEQVERDRRIMAAAQDAAMR